MARCPRKEVLAPGLKEVMTISPAPGKRGRVSLRRRPWLGALLLLVALPSLTWCQDNTPAPSAPAPDNTGLTAFEQIQFSATSLGTVIIEDTDVGYGLTDHLSGDVGIPIIFSRSPFSPVLSHDYYWSALLGQPYLDVKYSNVRKEMNYTTILTGTIPVTSEDRTYTTGRFGVDWFNHIDQPFGGVTPFLNFGASNGATNRFIMPRPYSTARPYETFGFLGDVEGGAEYKFGSGIGKGIGVGASYYVLIPAGTQKVFSRFVFPYSSLGGDGQHFRYFDALFETKEPIDVPGAQVLTGQSGSFDGCSVNNNVVSCSGGLSSIARDNGWSVWLDVAKRRNADVQIGYTRSLHYHLDMYSVTLNFDAKSLIRSLVGKQ